MKSLIELQKRLLPDVLSIIQKRFHILQYIGAMEPVGRRSLAATVGLTERVLRSEVDFLKEQKLLFSTSAGMSLTDDGREIVGQLEGFMRDLSGIDAHGNQTQRSTKNQRGLDCSR